MSLSLSNEINIQLMSEISAISKKLGIKTYIWGGFVQDIIQGMCLREHHDIDAFAENLEGKVNDIINLLDHSKYSYEYNNQFSMLKIKRGKNKIAINPVEFKNNLAFWKHFGEGGFFCFPKEWLDKEARNFYGIEIYTSGKKFEYCYRRLIKYLNPEWEQRAKDKKALGYYENEIECEMINQNDLLRNVWSYNPYWIKKGYNAFESPVLVIGKDYIKNT